MEEVAEGPFDLWIQAASGGESMLTNMVLEGLVTFLAGKKKLQVLATSGTKQGIDSLIKGCKSHSSESTLDITVAYFPFDAPGLMEKAFNQFAPKLAVIVETELWPGFLITASGKTMQDGKPGEDIKVRNMDSQRIIMARISRTIATGA